MTLLLDELEQGEIRGWKRILRRKADGSYERVVIPVSGVEQGERPGQIEWALFDRDVGLADFLNELKRARETGDYSLVVGHPRFDQRYLPDAELGIVSNIVGRAEHQERRQEQAGGFLAPVLRSLPPASLAALTAVPFLAPFTIPVLAGAGAGAGAAAKAATAVVGAPAQATTQALGTAARGQFYTPLPFGKAGSIAADPSRENLKATAIASGTEVVGALVGAPGAISGSALLAAASGVGVGAVQAGGSLAQNAAAGRPLDAVRAAISGAFGALRGFVSLPALEPGAAPALTAATALGGAAARAGEGLAQSAAANQPLNVVRSAIEGGVSLATSAVNVAAKAVTGLNLGGLFAPGLAAGKVAATDAAAGRPVTLDRSAAAAIGKAKEFFDALASAFGGARGDAAGAAAAASSQALKGS